MGVARRWTLLLPILLTMGCGSRPGPGEPAALAHAAEGAAPHPGAGSAPPFRLVDVAGERGLAFRHSCGTRRPLSIVETMGGGCAFFDFDNDGYQDIFLVSSGQDFRKPAQEPGSKLFRNSAGRFEDVTENSGVVVDGYAAGCCVGDFDNDGREDLFVTGFGRNWLFRNLGGGRFRDVTREAGILLRPCAWGIGCSFVDVNRDGRLDLFVGNYVRYDPAIPYCRTAEITHGCTPNQYSTQRNELYLNVGNGKFSERAMALGAGNSEGAHLGVVACDFDQDGWQDLFIANDGTPNALLHNRRGRFQEIAQASGVAYGEDGIMRAGMGADAGDIDGDGRFDIVVTNWQTEPTSLFHNAGGMNFVDHSYRSGMGTPSLNHLKFGVCFVDLDGDGRQDLYQGNGHVFDNVEQFNDIDKFEQMDQVFMNWSGQFHELPASTGGFPALLSVTRSVASGDFNNDGAPDLLISSLDRPVRLLENRRTSASRWVGLKLVGSRSNRSAIGARVELRSPSGLQVREVRSGGSYMGQSDLRVLFGVGPTVDPSALSLRIRWPNAAEESIAPVAVNRYVTVSEG
jgi:hypothetical protein